ncbi:putative cysteine-rich receptor-like protein kinase 9 [Lactuca sativa]|uniref:putative cysteine-rich receptor-like protein kinase 9 n=1 Tax=Lactuca sativa TaxID=4236 RepID=UPI001C68A60A|nr:putative cysteine-rich receptor-like protein kinase 9 [Lactuca sativa]
MDNFRLRFFVSLLIVTQLVSVTIAETDFWYQYCYGTYTASSSFKRNVDDVLYSITKTNNGYGFFNQTAGEGLDKVNAVALCRADVDQSDCERCVDDASRKLQENCIYQKEAMGCYDYCQLVYSNSSLLYSTVMDKDDTKCFNNPSFTSNWTSLKPSMVNLFYQLRTEASKGGSLRKYAARSMSVIPDSSTISGLVQCTPDLSESQCNQCLVDAINLLLNCSFGRTGSRVYKRGCNARYELYRFFNETWFPTHSPSLQSPQSGLITETKGTYIKGQVIGILFAAGALIAISGFFIWHRHHFKQKHKGVCGSKSEKIYCFTLNVLCFIIKFVLY